MKKTVLLVGAGAMAIEYSKVLAALNVEFTTVGRSEVNAQKFKEITGFNVIPGGIEKYIQTVKEMPSLAIIATGVEVLAETTTKLINAGVKTILCEKPGGINQKEIAQVSKLAEENGAKVFLAYNRRFYASVQKAKEIIDEDGGVTSFNFEFTEWSHVIAPLEKAKGIKEHLFFNNSTHVVDLAFYLGGKPKEISCFLAGSLPWHKTSSIFAGAGISMSGALFSYQANWEAPGRWGVEVLTKSHRLYLRPMETLQIQKIGSVQIGQVELQDKYDKDYKPGLFKQVEAFLVGQFSNFSCISEQLEIADIYYKMAGYSD